MHIIAQALSSLKVGEAQVHRNLTLFPLLGEGLAAPGYELLDEALEQGTVRITEISEAGSVPELRLHNLGEQSVLLLDGEELIGAKQNRILNLTVLAPARQVMDIPVSCVEAGRWHALSEEFVSAKRAHYASGRARKASQVSDSLKKTRSRRSDQSDVWSDISMKSRRLGAKSATAAAAAMYESRHEQLEEYQQAFAPVSGQLGAVFMLDGKIISLDVFDAERTCERVLSKLVQSCALDAIDAVIEQTLQGQLDNEAAVTQLQPIQEPHAVQAFLNTLVDSQLESFPSVGLGEDVRFTEEQVLGGALVVDTRLIHLCAFPNPNAGHTQQGRSSRVIRRSRLGARHGGRFSSE